MATWRDRWRDAQGYWKLAQSGYDPKSNFGNHVAGVAILAAIAANDAVCLRLTGKLPKSDSHRAAIDLLKEACKGKVWENDASDKSRQLIEVLRQKTEVQYSGGPLGAERIGKIMKQVERFIEWAGRVLTSET